MRKLIWAVLAMASCGPGGESPIRIAPRPTKPPPPGIVVSSWQGSMTVDLRCPSGATSGSMSQHWVVANNRAGGAMVTTTEGPCSRLTGVSNNSNDLMTLSAAVCRPFTVTLADGQPDQFAPRAFQEGSMLAGAGGLQASLKLTGETGSGEACDVTLSGVLQRY